MPECDTRAALPMLLADSAALVDHHVTTALATAATKPPAQRIADVHAQLGAWSNNLSNVVESKIEAHFNGVGLPFVGRPTRASTKYANLRGVAWSGFAATLGPSMLVAGHRIGLDKLGHFFQQGYEYYKVALAQGLTVAQLTQRGKNEEAGRYGLRSTGVYSRADIEANLAGFRFYQSLAAGPFPVVFNIRQHISRKWNEEIEPNDYHVAYFAEIWSNILCITTRTWTGTITLESGQAVPISFTWRRPTPAMQNNRQRVAATYSYNNPQVGPLTGSIDGFVGYPKVNQNLTTHNRVVVLARWGRRQNAGWLMLTNTGDERALSGTWGRGQQFKGGGSISLAAP